jgi:hypothetical protein
MDRHEQALAAARQWFAYWRQHRDADPLLNELMSPGAGSEWVRHLMRRLAVDSLDGRLSVVAAAREGDPDAIVVVGEMIQALLSARVAMPAELAAYALDRDAGLLHRPRQRGPNVRDRGTRDWLIMLIVAALVDRFELPATGPRSACGIVSEAYILLSRKGVEKVWLRYGRIGAPTVPGWSQSLFDLSGGLRLSEPGN